MNIKLTYSQFITIYDLFRRFVLADHPEDMTDKLLHCHMVNIYKKLYNRAVKAEQNYSIKITSEEAIAFWLYWKDHSLKPSTFEGNLLNQTIAVIDREFA